MGLGAIVVIGDGLDAIHCTTSQQSLQESVVGEPLECVEIMGRSMLERSAEGFARVGVEVITVLAPTEFAHAVRPFSITSAEVKIELVDDMGAAFARKFREYSERGIEHTFVISGSLYTETDLLDLFYFHREARQTSTRANERHVPLDLWVVDCAKASETPISSVLGSAGVSYFIRAYVNCLAHARDLRRLVSDVLCGRCAMRPPGVEVRPGIWIEEGAEIHRRARIVAPAYIGAGSKLREDTLVTRCSTIERDCYLDYGTVVEDSSVLANTHIGIWLDVCHSVASGNKLFNLERNVIIEISDPSVMRTDGGARHELRSPATETYEPRTTSFVLEQQSEPQKSPFQRIWQFGANLTQG